MNDFYFFKALNLFPYSDYKGIGLESLIFLIFLTLLIIVISKYIFGVKLEKNLFSEEELTTKPLYSQRDLLLQEKSSEFHREETIDEFPVLSKPTWMTRIVILAAVVSIFVIPLSTIWMRNLN